MRAGFVPYLGAAIAFSAWGLAQLIPETVSIEIWSTISSASAFEVCLLAALFGFIEALFPLCHYLPGTILYAGLVASGAGGVTATGLALSASAGILPGLCISYLIGRSFSNAWFLRPYAPLLGSLRQRADRLGMLLDAVCSLHPNNIAALMVVYGLAGVPISRHLALGMACTLGVVWVGTLTIMQAAQTLTASPGSFQLLIGIALAFLGVFLGVRALTRPRPDPEG